MLLSPRNYYEEGGDGMSQDLLERKGWAHQLIVLVAEKHGLFKDDVYWNMSKYLGRKESLCHFGVMDSPQTDEAINCLLRMLKSKKQLHRRGDVRVRGKNQLTTAEMKEAISKLPKNPKLPLFERWFRKLCG